MRRNHDIEGLPVISIEEGLEVGRVKLLVIDACQRRVAAVALDEETWCCPPQVFEWSAVSGIGDEAVMITSASHCKPITEMPEVAKIAADNVLIKSSKVFTRSGRYIGTAEDFLIDEISGHLSAIETLRNSAQDIVTLPIEDVVTLSAKTVVVDHVNPESVSNDHAQGTRDAVNTNTAQPRPPFVKTDLVPNAAREKPHEPQPQQSPIADGVDEVAAAFNSRGEAYLIGKIAGATITAEDGTLIVEQGTVITAETILAAKAKGVLNQLLCSVDKKARR